MKLYDCPRCKHHSLAPTGGFLSCGHCGYAITAHALAVEQQPRKALRQLRILRNSTTIIMAEKNPVRKDLLRRAQSDLPAALSLIASLFMILVAITSSLFGSN